MRKISSGSNTVRGAFDTLYEKALGKREIVYMEVNGMVFIVIPEEALRFPNFKIVEDHTLKEEAEKRGMVMIPRKDLQDNFDEEEFDRIMDEQKRQIKHMVKKKIKRVKK